MWWSEDDYDFMVWDHDRFVTLPNYETPEHLPEVWMPLLDGPKGQKLTPLSARAGDG